MTCESTIARIAHAGMACLLAAGLGGCHAGGAIDTEAWVLPASGPAEQPDLSLTPAGEPLLSWVEPVAPGRKRLVFARFDGQRWRSPTVVATAPGFGSALDTPHVRMTADGAVWAQWLQPHADGPRARDVVLARSSDGGAHWTPPVAVNTDDTPSEHGFAALWPAARDRLGIAWLDGRATVMPHAAAGGRMGAMDHHAPRDIGHATMLRSATFGPALDRAGEAIADATTCDCCRTSVAMDAGVPVIAYRDRSPANVRDIALLRMDAARWSAPQLVHADGWVLDGCPMNGPAIASDGSRLAVAWFTAAGDRPRVRAAFARGNGFTAPVELAAGPGVLGNVGLALSSGDAWMTWLQSDPAGPGLHIARIAPGGRVLASRSLAAVAGQGRGSGDSRVVATHGVVFVVWTDRARGTPVLRGARVPAGS